MTPERMEQRRRFLSRMHGRHVGDGWRLLREDEVIVATDETTCMSTQLSGVEDWLPMTDPKEWADVIGHVVSDFVAKDDDIDGWERAFRRRVDADG